MAKTCLRCDWQGDTDGPSCPACGARSLYVARRPEPAPAVVPEGALPDDLLADERTPRTAPLRTVGGAVAVVLAVAFLVTRSPGDGAAPGPRAPILDAAPIAESVGTAFADAFGDLDATAAEGYLADDADLSGLTRTIGGPGAEGSRDDFRILVEMLAADGYRQFLDRCEATREMDAGLVVSCGIDVHLIGSDVLGFGPYRGGHLDLVVDGDEIVTATMSWGAYGDTRREVWDPFSSWVAGRHPEDADAMFADDAMSWAALDERSIALWRQHVPTYVAARSDAFVHVARRFMAARNHYDAETAMSLVASGGLVVPVADVDPVIPGMPDVGLDRREVRLAFEAERMLEVRYRALSCRPAEERITTPLVEVECAYEMDSLVRRLAGLDPLRSTFVMELADGRVRSAAFPWLNLSFPEDNPAGTWAFTRWLRATDPEALEPMGLFRIEGQQMTLILTPDRVDRLGRYLHRYERSIAG